MISSLQEIVKFVIDCNPAVVKKYIDGDHGVTGYFVGLILKVYASEFNPKDVVAEVEKQLSEIHNSVSLEQLRANILSTMNGDGLEEREVIFNRDFFRVSGDIAGRLLEKFNIFVKPIKKQ